MGPLEEIGSALVLLFLKTVECRSLCLVAFSVAGYFVSHSEGKKLKLWWIMAKHNDYSQKAQSFHWFLNFEQKKGLK